MAELVKSALTDQIYEILKQRIINLELKPGTKVDISSLASEFDVSETPIRDALKKLSKDDLIKTESRRGYYVVRLSKKDILEIYDLRKLLESHALESSIRNIESSELRRLKRVWTRLSEVDLQDTDRSKFYLTDQEFHLKIIKKCDNQRLQAVFSQIYDLVRICQHMYMNIDNALEEHMAIIEAIEQKDLNKAKKLLELHIDRARDRVLKSLEKLEEND